MSKVLGPGFSFRARGSVGRVQYRKVKRDNIVCLNLGKSRVVSGPQAAVRACMSSLSVLWRTLSSGQLTAWQSFGAAFNFRWGGFAYFTYINMPRCRAGLPLLSWPPGFVSSAWELDVNDDLVAVDVAAAGIRGLWELFDLPVPELAPGVDVLPDTFWDVNIDGDISPLSV